MFGSGIDEGTKVGFVDYSNLVNYDLRNGAGTWSAMTQSSNEAGVDAGGGSFEFGVPHRPQSGMQGAALEAYREQWSVEDPANRKTRFTTEKTLCLNAPFGAQTAVLRRRKRRIRRRGGSKGIKRGCGGSSGWRQRPG